MPKEKEEMNRLSDENLQRTIMSMRTTAALDGDAMIGYIINVSTELLLARKVIEQSKEIMFVFGGGGGMENIIHKSDLSDLEKALDEYNALDEQFKGDT